LGCNLRLAESKFQFLQIRTRSGRMGTRNAHAPSEKRNRRAERLMRSENSPELTTNPKGEFEPFQGVPDACHSRSLTTHARAAVDSSKRPRTLNFAEARVRLSLLWRKNGPDYCLVRYGECCQNANFNANWISRGLFIVFVTTPKLALLALQQVPFGGPN
jgi:hypothetical protein